MGDRYVEITREDMENFIKRSYRPYRPKEGRTGDILTFTLRMGPNVGLRIHTSLSVGRTEVRGVGDDAIEVFLVSLKLTGRREYLMNRSTLKKNGIVLVMRTKNWRSALDDRVDKLIDMYEDSPEYWEKRASGDPAEEETKGPSPKQLSFIQTLVDRIWQRGLQDKIHWGDFGLNRSSKPTDFTPLTSGRGGSASRFIEHAKSVLEDAEVAAEHNRQVNDQGGGAERPTDQQIRAIGGHLRGKIWLWDSLGISAKFGPAPETPGEFRENFTAEQAAEILNILDKAPKSSGGGTATFSRLQDQSWGIRGQNLVEGDWVTVTKKSGQSSKVQVGEIVWTGPDGTTVARIGGQRRYASEEEPDITYDIDEPLGFDLYGQVPQSF